MINKIFSLIILTLVSSTSWALDAENCGLNEDNTAVEPFNETICPQDTMLKGLYSLFPDLTIKSVQSFNLDYRDSIIEGLVDTPISNGQRKLQDASGYFHKVILLVITMFALFSAWSIAWEFSKGKEGERGKSVNVPLTLFLMASGSFLLVNVDGFYIYQWFVMICAFIGLAFSNYVISVYAYLVEVNSNPLILEAKNENFINIGEAHLMAEREIDLSLCINQLITNDVPRLRNGVFFWSPTPLLDHYGWSSSEDGANTPIEVFNDGIKVVLNYGSGSSPSENKNIADLIHNSSPQVCGREFIYSDLKLQEVAATIHDDYSNSSEVFKTWALTELNKQREADAKTDELVVNNGNESVIVSDLNKKFHKSLMSLYRNPKESQKRMEAFYKSTEIAEDIRRYNCLLDPINNIQESGDASSAVNLSCVSVLRKNSLGEYAITTPQKFYADSIVTEKGAVEVEKERLISSIRDKRQGLVDFHVDNTINIYQSFLDNRSVKSGSRIEQMVRDMRQKGMFMFGTTFISSATFINTNVSVSSPFEAISPRFELEPMGDYYIPNVSEDGLFVGKALDVPGSFIKPMTNSYSKSEMKAEIEAMAKTKDNFYSPQKEVEIKDGNERFYEDSIRSLLSKTGFGFSESLFVDSKFLEVGNLNGWSRSEFSNQFLLKCFGGRIEDFNIGMIEQCKMLQLHPISTMKALGESLFSFGAGTLVTASTILYTSAVFSRGESFGGTSGGGSPENSKATKKGADDIGRWQKVMSTIRTMMTVANQLLYVIAFAMMVCGLILGYVLPYLPSLVFISSSILYLLTVAVGVIFGSVLVASMFKSRVKGNEEQSSDASFRKLLNQVIVKPIILITGLVVMYIIMEVAIRLAMMFSSMLTADLTSVDAGLITYYSLVTISVLGSIYLYLKVYLSMVDKLTEVEKILTRYVDVGAHAVNHHASTAGGVMQAYTASKILQRSQGLGKKSVSVDAQVLRGIDSVKTRLSSGLKNSDTSDAGSDISTDVADDENNKNNKTD